MNRLEAVGGSGFEPGPLGPLGRSRTRRLYANSYASSTRAKPMAAGKA